MRCFGKLNMTRKLLNTIKMLRTKKACLSKPCAHRAKLSVSPTRMK